MSSFDLKQIQIKLEFESAKVNLLNEVSDLWSKSNHAKNLCYREWKMTSRAQLLERRKK